MRCVARPPWSTRWPGPCPVTPTSTGSRSVAELDAFVAAWRWTGQPDSRPGRTGRGPRPAPTAALVVEPRRGRLRRWPSTPPWPRHSAVPQLVDHDGWGWHLHASQPSAPLATRMAVEAAMAFVDLIRVGELDRRGHLRSPGLRRRRRRPVQEPLPTVLRRHLRQSSRSRDLPPAASSRQAPQWIWPAWVGGHRRSRRSARKAWYVAGNGNCCHVTNSATASTPGRSSRTGRVTPFREHQPSQHYLDDVSPFAYEAAISPPGNGTETPFTTFGAAPPRGAQMGPDQTVGLRPNPGQIRLPIPPTPLTAWSQCPVDRTPVRSGRDVAFVRHQTPRST